MSIYNRLHCRTLPPCHCPPPSGLALNYHLPPRPPECGGFRCAPPHLAQSLVFRVRCMEQPLKVT
jgi:hypothetical protein